MGGAHRLVGELVVAGAEDLVVELHVVSHQEVPRAGLRLGAGDEVLQSRRQGAVRVVQPVDGGRPRRPRFDEQAQLEHLPQLVHVQQGGGAIALPRGLEDEVVALQLVQCLAHGGLGHAQLPGDGVDVDLAVRGQLEIQDPGAQDGVDVRARPAGGSRCFGHERRVPSGRDVSLTTPSGRVPSLVR